MFRRAKTRSVALIGYRALSDCAGKGSLFIVTVLAARRLSQDTFGIFSLASTFGWILAVATDCGIQLHVARSVATRPAEAGAVLRRWIPVRLWTSFGAVAVVLATLAVARPSQSEGTAIFLLAATYIASGLIEFLYYFCRGLGRSDVESSITLAHRLTMLACAGVVLTWMPTLTAIAAALLLPAIAALAFAIVIARRLASKASRDVAQEPALPGREFRLDVLPIGAGIVLSALYFRIDLFLVGAWIGPTAAGAYNAVFRLVEALRLFPAAVLAVVLPSLVRAGDRRPLVEVATTVTLFGALVAGGGLITAPWLVGLLYGDAYTSAVPAFRVLLLSFPLLSLNYALTHQVIGWHGQRAYVATCAAALVANLALNAVLIPADGLTGAAWATFWTEIIVTIGCGWALSGLAARRQAAVVPAGAA